MQRQCSWICITVAALGLCAFIGLAPTPAEVKDKEKQPEAPPKITDEVRQAEDAATAFRMADIGRRQKSPEALIAAARVIGTLPFTKLDLKDAKVEKAEQFDAVKEAKDMLKEALALESTNTKAVRDLSEAAEKAIDNAKRGAIGGPRIIRGTLGRNDHRDVYNIAFRGGELAVIRVNNRSDRGDIDLSVFDESDNLVAVDRRTDDDAHVTWFPRRTHRYRVVVHLFRGFGPQVRYTLVTN